MNTNPGNRPFEENGPRAAISTGPSLTDFNALVGLLQGAYNSLPSPGVQMYIQPQNTVHDAQVQPYHIQLLPPATGPGLAQWQVPQPAPTASQSILIVPPTPPYIHPSSSYLQPTTVHWMPPQPPPQPPIIPPPPPPPPQQVHPVAPVGSIPDDDKHLVCALKTFGAQKITLRQALEKLNGVNSHSASAWKDYFLDNLDAFYPLTKADQEPHPQATSSLRSATQGQSPSPSHPVLPPIRKSQMDASKPPPADRDSDTSSSTSNPRPPPPDAPSTSHSPISSRLAATYSRPLEYRSPPRVPDPAPHRSPDPDSAIDTQRSISGLRRRQGEPDAEFYAGTQIPPSNSDIRPRAPRPVRPTQDAGYRDTTGKSSDAYNVFFIHYLRWYVARVSRRKLTRQHILTELAKETPHYGVDAWRKHWEDDPEIPGHILAEAQRRADEHASLLSDEGEGDREYNEGSKGAPAHRDAIRRGDDGDGSDGAYDTDPAQLTRAPPRKVNVDDIRAMALYILEVDRDSSESWDVSRSRRKSFWREFSKRPENALRRSLDGWVKAAQYHESSILAYYEKRKASAQRITLPLPRRSVKTAPQAAPATAGKPAASVNAASQMSGNDPAPQSNAEAKNSAAASTEDDLTPPPPSEVMTTPKPTVEDYPSTRGGGIGPESMDALPVPKRSAAQLEADPDGLSLRHKRPKEVIVVSD